MGNGDDTEGLGAGIWLALHDLGDYPGSLQKAEPDQIQ